MLIRRQAGMSLLSILMLLSVAGFLASVTFKMLPHYLDNMSLQKMIQSAATDKSQSIHTIPEFYQHISKGMQVNSIRDMKPEDVMKVEVSGNEFVVNLKYERREPIIANLDLVARFDKTLRVKAQ